MKVGSLVRRKPHPITRKPELLGLVMEIADGSPADGGSIRVAFLGDHGEALAHAKYWRCADNFEVLS
jgi:hypothetical protein